MERWGGGLRVEKVGMVKKIRGGDRHGAKVADMNINIYAYGGAHGFAHVRVGCA